MDKLQTEIIEETNLVSSKQIIVLPFIFLLLIKLKCFIKKINN